MINLLYSLFTYRLPDSAVAGYYAKKRDFIVPTSRQTELLDAVLPPGDGPEQLRFACFACPEALRTCYGEEILKLDPNNTYFDAGRSPEQPFDSLEDCVAQLLPAYSAAARIRARLDTDIADRLVVPSSMEIVAAAGLQALRWL